MLFHSLPFLFKFIPICLLGYHLAAKLGHTPKIVWLVAASLFFYQAWNARFLGLLLFSVLLNFLLSHWIASRKQDRRSRVLALGIALNLALLFYYKYLFALLAWIAESSAGARLGVSYPHPILLPLGISFFTFTQIGYLIDLAQGQAEKQDFLHYLLFVTFFPHLIAGPLLHHREIMPQFDGSGSPSANSSCGLQAENLTLGFTWFVLGLAKKVLIADKLAPAADLAFSQHGSAGMLSAWSGLLIYCMQLYFDFSGYSDMAIGLARMFGIHFPMNFDSPWKATSVTEYWQRWHMTLTRYVTLYLYNPTLLWVQRRRIASGKKISRKILSTPEGLASLVAFPTMFTMVVTGVWHGAGTQYWVFGALHGVYLTANQAWRHLSPTDAPSQQSISRTTAMRSGVMIQAAVALVFFRSESTSAAFHMLYNMLGGHGLGHSENTGAFVTAAALLPAVWFLPNTQEILGQQNRGTANAGQHWTSLMWRPNLLWAIVIASLFFAALVNLDQASSFLYFQF